MAAFPRLCVAADGARLPTEFQVTAEAYVPMDLETEPTPFMRQYPFKLASTDVVRSLVVLRHMTRLLRPLLLDSVVRLVEGRSTETGLAQVRPSIAQMIANSSAIVRQHDLEFISGPEGSNEASISYPANHPTTTIRQWADSFKRQLRAIQGPMSVAARYCSPPMELTQSDLDLRQIDKLFVQLLDDPAVWMHSRLAHVLVHHGYGTGTSHGRANKGGKRKRQAAEGDSCDWLKALRIAALNGLLVAFPHAETNPEAPSTPDADPQPASPAMKGCSLTLGDHETTSTAEPSCKGPSNPVVSAAALASSFTSARSLCSPSKLAAPQTACPAPTRKIVLKKHRMTHISGRQLVERVSMPPPSMIGHRKKTSFGKVVQRATSRANRPVIPATSPLAAASPSKKAEQPKDPIRASNKLKTATFARNNVDTKSVPAPGPATTEPQSNFSGMTIAQLKAILKDRGLLYVRLMF